MTLIGELLDTIDVALRRLAQARTSAVAAAAAATEAHDTARSMGLKRPIVTMNEVKGRVDAEVARLAVMIANLERARLQTRLLAGVSASGAPVSVVLPGLSASTAERGQRRSQEGHRVRSRRTGFTIENAGRTGIWATFVWATFVWVTDFSHWVNLSGYWVITGAVAWVQFKYWDVDGIPARRNGRVWR